MSLVRRRGFTLVELLVALLLFGIVSAGIYKVLLTNQRLYQAQTQRIDVQQNVRAAATIFAGEFRELDAVDGDISAMTANSITIRAMRQLGFLCDAPALPAAGPPYNVTMTVRATPLYGSQMFTEDVDSLLIFYEGDQTSRQDDGWHLGSLTAVAPLNCSDGKPGWKLSSRLAAFAGVQVNQAGAIAVGSPVRGFETVTYLAYQASDSRWYIGLQTAGGTQPLIGPITGRTGLRFTYYAANGAVTAVPAQVVRIAITVGEQTAQPVQQSGVGGGLVTKVDSLTTQVSLRNNARF